MDLSNWLFAIDTEKEEHAIAAINELMAGLRDVVEAHPTEIPREFQQLVKTSLEQLACLMQGWANDGNDNHFAFISRMAWDMTEYVHDSPGVRALIASWEAEDNPSI